MDCIFCKIVVGEISSAKIYEDEHCIAFLDIRPIKPGHTLVIPKAHFATMEDAPTEVLGQMIAVVKELAPAVTKATAAAGFNLGVNNGSVAGQAVAHVHFHIIPRHEGDGLESWHGRSEYPEGEMEKMATAIRGQIA